MHEPTANPTPAPSPASAPTSAAQPSQSTQQPTQAPAQQQPDSMADLRSAMQSEVKRISGRNDTSVFGPEKTGQPVPGALPQYLTDANAPAPGQQLASPPAAEQTQPETEQPTPPPAEQPQPTEAPTAIMLPKFGKEFSIMEIEAALEGYNYYHPKVMKLNEDFQRVAAESARIEQLKAAPEMVLIEALRGDQALRAKVLELVSQHSPEQGNAYQQQIAGQQSNEQIEALQKQIAELQGVNQQTREQAWQQHVQSTVQYVDNQVGAMTKALANEGINVTEGDLKQLTDGLTALLQVGRIKFEPKQIVGFYQQELGRIREKALQARNHALSGYHQQKRQAPPPPPTGGSPQPMQSPQPRNFAEGRALMKDRLELAMRNL